MSVTGHNDKLRKQLNILQFTVLVILILYFGKPIFIPLGFSAFISIILYPLCHWIERKGMPRGISIVLPVFIIITLLAGISYLMIAQLAEFSYEWSAIRQKLMETYRQLSVILADKLGVSAEKQIEIFEQATNSIGEKAFSFLGSTASSFSEGLILFIMIPIFSSLILYYRHKLINVIYHYFTPENRTAVHEIIKQSIHTYFNFIKGMALVYLTVGVLNSVGLALIGVPHPVFFGCVAAVLTFIPYVGIIIASSLPITVAWVTYDSIWYSVAVVLVFAAVQLLEAYLIFPMAVGQRMKINTLVIFLVILIGGILWGAAGMILFIPMVSIFKLIAEKTPKLKHIAEFLG